MNTRFENDPVALKKSIMHLQDALENIMRERLAYLAAHGISDPRYWNAKEWESHFCTLVNAYGEAFLPLEVPLTPLVKEIRRWTNLVAIMEVLWNMEKRDAEKEAEAMEDYNIVRRFDEKRAEDPFMEGVKSTRKFLLLLLRIKKEERRRK